MQFFSYGALLTRASFMQVCEPRVCGVDKGESMCLLLWNSRAIHTHLTHTQVLSKYGTWMTLFYPNPTAVELSNSTYKNSTLIFYSQGILEKQRENLP